MKKVLSILSFICVFLSCQDVAEKPKNLIPEDKMVNILYDFALIEGIKADIDLKQASLNPELFIYKKYKIDSIQFVKSNEYYSSDIDNYKKMYEKVKERIESEKSQLENQMNTKSHSKSKLNKEQMVK